MSEAAAIHAGVEPQESPLTPENWGKLGMWLFLAADAMTFGCLIVGYGILRHASEQLAGAVCGIGYQSNRVHDLPADRQQHLDGAFPVGDPERRQGAVPESFWD